MGTWHYQVFKKWDPVIEEWHYTIGEVYPGTRGRSRTRNGKEYGYVPIVSPLGNTKQSLIEDLERMLADAKKYRVLEDNDENNS